MSNFSDTKIPRTKDKRHQTPSKFSKQVPEQRNIYHCVYHDTLVGLLLQEVLYYCVLRRVFNISKLVPRCIMHDSWKSFSVDRLRSSRHLFREGACDPYHHWESWVILNLKVLKFDFSFSWPINVWPRTFDHKRCLTWYSCELKNSLN
ncbi:unnamed protein product [Malus baccata var. baccata]